MAGACPSRDEARQPRAPSLRPACGDRVRDIGVPTSPTPSCGCQQTAERTMTRQDSSPDLIERCTVLATVKTASRRLRRWPAASLDRRCARRRVILQAGTEKRRSNRTEKHDGRRRGSRDGGMVTSVDTKHKAGTTDISGFFRTINYRGLDIVLRQYLRQLLRSIILSARNRLYDPQTLRYLRK